MNYLSVGYCNSYQVLVKCIDPSDLDLLCLMGVNKGASSTKRKTE